MGDVVQLQQPQPRALVPAATRPRHPFRMAGAGVVHSNPAPGKWAIVAAGFICGMPFVIESKEG